MKEEENSVSQQAWQLFCRTGLPAQTVHKVCLVLAIATAPYTMLIPLYSW